MLKFWRIARYEYRQRVFTRGFVVIALLIPILMAAALGLGYIAGLTHDSSTPIGYVDLSGTLGDDPLLPPLRADRQSDEVVPLLAFADEDTARAALDAGQIQAYYVIPPIYPINDQVDLVYHRPPSDAATAQFWDFLQINLLGDQSPEAAYRAVAGNSLTVRTPDGSREIVDGNQTGLLIPVFAGMLLMLLFVFSSGYLMEAVTAEKTNRTMEVVITSVSPGQLIGGKLTGITAVALTYAVIWGISGALAIFVGGELLGMTALQNINLPAPALLTMLLLLLPSYVLLAAALIALGSTLFDSQEANAVGPLLIMLFDLPYILVFFFIQDPNSSLAVGMSLVPFFALPVLSLRMAMTGVPLWQIAASFGVLAISAGFAVWLAGRAFRLGMLRYGQRVSWRDLLGRAQAAGEGGRS